MPSTPRIIAHPRIMMGKPVIEGTRITVDADPEASRRGTVGGRYPDRIPASHARSGWGGYETPAREPAI